MKWGEDRVLGWHVRIELVPPVGGTSWMPVGDRAPVFSWAMGVGGIAGIAGEGRGLFPDLGATLFVQIHDDSARGVFERCLLSSSA